MHRSPRGRLDCAFGFASSLNTSALLPLFGAVGLPGSSLVTFLMPPIAAPDTDVLPGLDDSVVPDAPPPRS